MPSKTYEFTTEDVEYLRHGDKPLLTKVYKPRGEGPFPALVDSFRTSPRRPLPDPTGRGSLRRSPVHRHRNQVPTRRSNRDPTVHST